MSEIEYSPIERKLLSHFIYNFNEMTKSHSSFPIGLYRIAAENAFLYPDWFYPKYINALRIGLKNLNKERYRMTEEFDDDLKDAMK